MLFIVIERLRRNREKYVPIGESDQSIRMASSQVRPMAVQEQGSMTPTKAKLSVLGTLLLRLFLGCWRLGRGGIDIMLGKVMTSRFRAPCVLLTIASQHLQKGSRKYLNCTGILPNFRDSTKLIVSRVFVNVVEVRIAQHHDTGTEARLSIIDRTRNTRFCRSTMRIGPALLYKPYRRPNCRSPPNFVILHEKSCRSRLL